MRPSLKLPEGWPSPTTEGQHAATVLIPSAPVGGEIVPTLATKIVVGDRVLEWPEHGGRLLEVMGIRDGISYPIRMVKIFTMKTPAGELEEHRMGVKLKVRKWVTT